MASKEHTQWKEYLLNTRGLSPEVIQEAGLFPQGSRLCIPIKDAAGITLFHKRRRAPWSDVGPKYLYDKGSTAQLYGIHFKLNPSPRFFLVEGELDVLAMRTAGYNAFTSTGGAMTWKEEWRELLPDGVPTILYDNDDTGISGAIKTGLSLKHFIFSWAPTAFAKDVSDLLQATEDVDRFREFIDDEYRMIEIQIPDKITKTYLSELSNLAKLRTVDHGRTFLFELIRELKIIMTEAKPRNYEPEKKSGNQNRIDRAKQYPIDHIIDVKRRKALCPFHTENTPSLHVYPNNTAFCFGQCDKAFDSIDIYRQVHNCSFREALDALAPNI